MIGSGNGDEFDAADADALEASDLDIEWSTDPDRRLAVQYHVRHRSERFHIEAQRYRRKLRTKCLQRIDNAAGRQHHIKDEADFRFETLDKASHFGAELIDAITDGARLRQ